MRLYIPPSQLDKLKNIEKPDRERIVKKLDDIDHKISDLNISPDKVIEKRLKGPLHGFLQQRVGRWRLWFELDRRNDRLVLEYILSKKEAKKKY